MDIDNLVQNGQLSRALYTDADLFALEMDRIFLNTWVYVGHTSEITQPGDYKTSRIGSEPVIVSRTDDGDVAVLVNRCRHRGAMVCREASGNSKFFRCPYHAWTYRNNGALLGVPHRHRYDDDFSMSEWGLSRAPRVETYRGLIFASFNPAVPSLLEYLGPARRFIDATFDFSLSGEIDLSPGVTKHEYPGNWKLQMENGVDGYHTAFVHETYIGIVSRLPQVELKFGSHEEKDGWVQSFPNGHALLARRPDPRAVDFLQEAFPEYTTALRDKHGLEYLLDVLTHMNLFIFPNLFLIAHQIRVVHPISVDRTEVHMHFYDLSGAPDALNARRMKEHEAFYPALGFGTPDDYEVFSTVQAGLGATTVPTLLLTRGRHDAEDIGEGCYKGRTTDEFHQLNMYQQYLRLMRSE